MTQHFHKIACLAAALLLAGPVFGQTDTLKKRQVNLDLNFMAHGEYCGGGLPRAANSTEQRSAFIMGRTRLILTFDNTWLESRAVLQNTAVWGMSGNQALNLYEGWVKFKSPIGLFAQVGRIALSYDDGRIIGTNDFAAAALSHDALRVGYEGHGHKVHAIFSFNQNGSNVYYGTYYIGGAQLYKTMQTLWYHYDVPKFPLGASLLFMNLGLQAGVPDKADNLPRVDYMQFWGGYLNFHPEKFSLEASYYRQSGKRVNEEMYSRPVMAWMASVKAGYKPIQKLSLEAGYDHLSGDDFVPVPYGGEFGMPYHAVEKGFSPLYGSRTQFYGILDYFYESAYINGFTPGLQNAYIGVSGNPVGNFNGKVAYHYLAVATHLKDLDMTLGHSVELELSYDFNKFISLVVGYTHMFGTETMARLKQEGGSRHANWAWFSLVVNPRLFSIKW